MLSSIYYTLRMVVFGSLLSCTATAVNAATISVDTWYKFRFGSTGSILTDGTGAASDPVALAAPNPPWTFTLGPSGGTLTVVDLGSPGDEFEFFNFGSSILKTSVVADDGGSPCGIKIFCALDSAEYSKGSVALAQGAYELSGIVTDSPFGSGGAVFIVSTIPLPAGLLLLMTGVGSLLLLRRYRT